MGMEMKVKVEVIGLVKYNVSTVVIVYKVREI